MFKYFLSIMILSTIMYSHVFPQFASAVNCGNVSSLSAANKWVWTGDFNGDGMIDRLRFDGSKWWVALSKGYSFYPEGNYFLETNVGAAQHLPDYWLDENPGANEYYIGDFNGDGMTDIAAYFNTGMWKIALAYQDFSKNDPIYGFRVFSPWNTTAIFASSTNYSDKYVGDFNGDGKDDILACSYKRYWQVATSSGSGFNNVSTWKNILHNYNKIYVGDIEGDGDCDILTYTVTNNVWHAATSNAVLKSNQTPSNTFTNFIKMTEGQGAELNGPFFGDVDGDGDKDKIYVSEVTGKWWVAKSYPESNNLGNESCWWEANNSGSLNAIAGYCGDFNGDRLCDVAYLKSDGSFWVGYNSSPIPTPDNKKIVATWFLPFYENGKDGGLYNSTRDTDKHPVVGWGSGNTITGYYNSDNVDILSAQIDAMHKAGINLIIVDNTNGWNNVGVEYCKDNIRALFVAMRNKIINEGYCIPIAIALGYEYWGKKTITAYGQRNTTDPNFSTVWDWNNIGWNLQYNRQEVALNDIYNNFYLQFTDVYFKYLGRPLIISYLENGDDYPPRNDDGSSRNLWHSNLFTIIPAINWNNTYGYGGTGIEFNNGQASKKTWGWGAEWDLTHYNVLCHEQPYNAECMSVMPGAFCWNSKDKLGNYTVTTPERNGGDYYIKSWNNILKAKPNITLIGGWNNWNEETSIEGCVDADGVPALFGNGWNDLNGNPTYDWYLQITRTYAELFKEDTLRPGTYYTLGNDPNVYYWSGSSVIVKGSGFKPNGSPIINIPFDYSFTYRLSKTISDDEIINKPFEYNVNQNYPNPFNPATTIDYSIPFNSHVVVDIYNILGEKITTLANEVKTAGTYEINFDGSKLASGVYIYRFSAVSLESGERFEKSSKMLLMK